MYYYFKIFDKMTYSFYFFIDISIVKSKGYVVLLDYKAIARQYVGLFVVLGNSFTFCMIIWKGVGNERTKVTRPSSRQD